MADRQRAMFSAASVGLVVVAFIAWRSLRASAATATASSIPPTASLDGLTPYLAPMKDTIGGPIAQGHAIIIARDPFGIPIAPRLVQSSTSRSTVSQPTKAESPRWIVTAVLITRSRPAAVINDALVYIGDKLPDGVRLTAVQSNRVTLTDAQGLSHIVAVQEANSQ